MWLALKVSWIDEMKPILFNTEMVRAILDGRKTQTRRVVNDKVSLSFITLRHGNGFTSDSDESYLKNDILLRPKYQIGDILRVRETWGVHGINKRVVYKATEWLKNDVPLSHKWKPSIHMPKEYARIFLKVSNVRVERLQDINGEDCEKEGFDNCFFDGPIWGGEVYKWFTKLWNSTAKDGYKWEDNPYVFVYEFERIKHETL